MKAPTISVAAGTPVGLSAQKISAALGQEVVVLAGGDQILPSDLSTTPWQALARLRLLPGVRLGVVVPDVKSTAQAMEGVPPGATELKKQLYEVRPAPKEVVMSLCVHEEVGLPAALDGLSRMTGYAFDVSGSPAEKFTLTAKGTLDQVLTELSSAAGVYITVAK